MLEDPQSNDQQSTDQPDAAEAPAARAPRKTAAKKTTARKAPAKRTPAKKALAAAEGPEPGLEAAAPAEAAAEVQPAKKTAARKTTAKKATARKTTTRTSTPEAPVEPVAAEAGATEVATPDEAAAPSAALLFQPPATTTVTRRTRKSPAARKAEAAEAEAGASADATTSSTDTGKTTGSDTGTGTGTDPGDEAAARGGAKKTASRSGRSADRSGKGDRREGDQDKDEQKPADQSGDQDRDDDSDDSDDSEGSGNRRRRRRGGRRRRKPGEGGDSDGSANGSANDAVEQDDERESDDEGGESSSSRRRRRRRRSGDDGDGGGGDPQNTVTRVRRGRSAEDQITAVSGSTRLEAKKQRRREGREAGRRRAPIVSEAEFLARRESVDRVMVIRQRDELTQIAVLEDKVLVEHYVARESQNSIIGNVYLGRVQNVLPSMEAAFVDIGKGRNAVLYAGEVNWSSLGHKDGQPRKIESVLSSGQSVLVQVTKDPIGHKGARLTSQVSLAGRFLVYVPDGTTSGISRKLPDTERNRLKALLKEIVPEGAGVIVRTAAEGASEDELTRDVERLKARWEDIEKKSKGSAPQLLYGEPDLTLKVVRDLFTEDFGKLVIEGPDAWETVQSYVQHVAPDLEERLERFEPGDNGKDVFATYRIDEQIAKGLDRKVWLPSGGSLVIDRTEAMTVVDVNTGKFTGSGGNLEETVTKNNLEAAEEMVRQLRLRDIGGIIVIDFIDMVLESNRDLVLRRLVECLGRDRTRHQVAEVTSLGLVQMTRKRIGTGLVEAFSENCEHCQGRGVVIQDAPVEPKKSDDGDRRSGRRSRGGSGGGGRGRDGDSGSGGNNGGGGGKTPSPKDVAAMAKAENADRRESSEQSAPEQQPEQSPPGEATPAESTPAESTPDAPVTTRTTRRRGGRKPASESRETEPETSAASQAEPAAPPAAQSTPEEPAEAPKGASDVGAEAPVAEPAPEPPVAPEKPTVVTRTRRRSASRPAGPPVGGDVPSLSSAAAPAGVGEPPESGSVEPGTADADPGGSDAPVVEHVPIKKKGSRKR